MKKLLFSLVATLLLMTNNVMGQRFSVVNDDGVLIYYGIDYSEGENDVMVVKCPKDTSYRYSGNVVIPEKITVDGKMYEVTAVGGQAFQDCATLTGVTIPSSVKSINFQAFQGCTALTDVTLPEGLKQIDFDTFEGCSSLTEVAIPSGIETIRFRAFKDCTSLKHMEIPQSVTTIEYMVFQGCTALTDVTLPDSLEEIDFDTFQGCTSLMSLTIPASVKAIGNYAFADCSGLRTIMVEEGNTAYDSRDNCNALIRTSDNVLLYGSSTTVIPKSVTSIAARAFVGRSGLESVIIPAGVTAIGDGAFAGCIGLKSIVVEPENTIYDSREQCNGIIRTKDNVLVTGCTSTIVPESVTAIGNNAFEGQDGITELVVPLHVTEIEPEAYLNCRNLKRIDLHADIQFLGSSAFVGCTSLETVCSHAENPKDINESVFSTRDKETNKYREVPATLYVPVGSKERYEKAAGWKLFQNILEMDEAFFSDVKGIGSTTTTDGPIYDLNGRMLHQPATARGIYIVNGRKVLRR